MTFSDFLNEHNIDPKDKRYKLQDLNSNWKPYYVVWSYENGGGGADFCMKSDIEIMLRDIIDRKHAESYSIDDIYNFVDSCKVKWEPIISVQLENIL